MSAQFMWFDVTAGKPDEVREFYAALFDWATAPETSAGPGWIADGAQPWAGVVETDDAAPGRWLPYVLVDDLDVAARRASSLGAAVVRDRTDGPAGTSIIIADPGGAQVALFKPFTGPGLSPQPSLRRRQRPQQRSCSTSAWSPRSPTRRSPARP